MTDLTKSPFTLGARVAFVSYYNAGVPTVREAFVAKVTPSGRFQVRYPHMPEGEMSDTVYQPEVEVVEYSTYTKGWRGNPRAGSRTRDRDAVRLWDESVEKLVEKRDRHDRYASMLNHIQKRVSSMRATHEGVEELIDKLAQALGLTGEE